MSTIGGTRLAGWCAASTPSAGASSWGGPVIETATSSAGTFLTNGSGRAVYLWAKHTGDMSTSAGACAGAEASC